VFYSVEVAYLHRFYFCVFILLNITAGIARLSVNLYNTKFTFSLSR